ncbi:peroxidase family protein [Spirillospora sp. NPDC048911]|uniref:peroxidase family protein n=1 Tax=Spirillospora sp. NPDC048911 TaxID=3364527 RepID=UPI00371936C6
MAHVAAEHNAICDRLRGEFPGWSDEELYQRAHHAVRAARQPRRLQRARLRRPELLGPAMGTRRAGDPDLRRLAAMLLQRLGGASRRAHAAAARGAPADWPGAASPHPRSTAVRTFTTFGLSDQRERDDSTGPYRKSILTMTSVAMRLQGLKTPASENLYQRNARLLLNTAEPVFG